MLLYWVGVLAFAACILVSVSLHELGHMLTAKRFGMKVTRYFVGFGPTLFSFHVGETEYGLKAIPLGGFCKIVGMTPQDDDVDPADEPRAMWRFPVWKRTIVMGAGSATHFLLAIVATWIAAMTIGLQNLDYPQSAAQESAQIQVAECVQLTNVPDCTVGQGSGVAAPAHGKLQTGDVVTMVGTTPVTNFEQLTNAIRVQKPGPTDFQVTRNGATQTVSVDLLAAQRPPVDNPNGALSTVSVAGVGWDTSSVPAIIHYNALTGIPATGDYAWYLVKNTFSAIGRVPERVPALWHSITGGERDPDTPISVVGASRIGGEALQHGVPEVFLSVFIALNVFIGIFNLLPLLPVDGGHIAIAWYERARSWIYARRRKPDPGRVDYYKLMPLTYAVILIGGAFTVLTVTADIVNPIQVFNR